MGYNLYTPVVKSFTPDTSAYGSGDVVGGLLTLNMPTTRGLIAGVTVAVGEAGKALAGTLYIYNDSPTSFADNAAWAPVHADNQKQIAELLMPAAVLQNSRNVYILKYGGGSTMPLVLYANNTLYAYYVTTSTPTFGASQNVTITIFPMGEK